MTQNILYDILTEGGEISYDSTRTVKTFSGERVYHGRANTLTETILGYDATRVVLVVEVEKKKPDLPEYERK